jgi:ATP:ADP antiporter, AAA family
MLGIIAQVREHETVTALLMFCYSLLAMASYNVIKPVTRSKFISDLGVDNLPYVQLLAGLLIGLLMTGYAWVLTRLPHRWAIPISQAATAGIVLGFWFLFRTDQWWVSVAFYLFGLILGILLISQFWTVANLVYDPRQAKRIFGFIGGGSSLGGMLGSFITDHFARRIGTENLLLISGGMMLCCVAVVAFVFRREPLSEEAVHSAALEERGVGVRRAFQMLRESKHLQTIALVISFSAVGAGIIEQQLNMAAASSHGEEATTAITGFLARVQLWTSGIGFIIQVAFTSRIHRYLGIGFALMLLPLSLGATGVVMLLNAALWAPGLARVLDQSLRYTVDKTTREILYMPLPSNLKFEAKPFVDVTVDRFAKGIGAVLLLVLIKPWGFGLNWQQISYASVAMTALWLFMAVRARHGYSSAFRQSIENRDMKPAEIRLSTVDLSTVETLVQELSSADERRVIYAVDILESLEKRHLITPLLLYHESPAVRVRVLNLLAATPPDDIARWLPAVRRMMREDEREVRAAAMGVLASFRNEQVYALLRVHLRDQDPRIALMAAMTLTSSPLDEDRSAAEYVVMGLLADSSETGRQVQRDFAVAIRHMPDPQFRRLLIPLLHGPDPDVAEEAMRSVCHFGAADFIFVPTLVSLLRDRRLKSSARDVLVAQGPQVLGILGHFLRDPEEDIWVRRHIPATIALIPCQKSVDVLVDALNEKDGFLRFKVIAALERLRRTHDLTFPHAPLEQLTYRESDRYVAFLRLYSALFASGGPDDSLLARALSEKMSRAMDRMYRLLGLIYPWKDIAAVRWSIEHDTIRGRASALEYLDNVLKGEMRRRLLPVLEEPTPDPALNGRSDLVKGGLSSNDALLKLLGDPDPTIAASAAYYAGRKRAFAVRRELERIVAAGNGRAAFVVETAAWSLTCLNPQSMRPAQFPIVELADRLRGLQLFAFVTVDELFRIAAAGRQLHHDKGSVLYREALLPGNLQFLLDGRVTAGTAGCAAREIASPAALAFQEVLESRPMSHTVSVVAPSICLALESDEYRTMLADNTELVEGLFTTLCRAEASDPARAVFKGKAAPERASAEKGHLKQIDKVMALEAVPLFVSISAAEMLSLATIADEMHLTPGTLLFGATDEPALHVLLSGEVSLESHDGAPQLLAGPNDAIAVYETLAGLPLGRSARVTRKGVALRIGRDELFDLLGQRPALLEQLFSALFREASGYRQPRVQRQAQ